MTCEICGEAFAGMVCNCGWRAPQLAPIPQPPRPKPADIWHTRPCPGCVTTTIRERIGYRGEEFCKWCLEKQAKELGVELEAREAR